MKIGFAFAIIKICQHHNQKLIIKNYSAFFFFLIRFDNKIKRKNCLNFKLKCLLYFFFINYFFLGIVSKKNIMFSSKTSFDQHFYFLILF